MVGLSPMALYLAAVGAMVGRAQCAQAGKSVTHSQGTKPNFLFLLADDFGHYDVGLTGNGEANTPNLDKLAGEGILLNRHYVYQFCSPTRSSIMSGRLPIHVNEANRPNSESGCVDLRMTTVPQLLASAGYMSHGAGKWHAGAHFRGQMPIQRNFSSWLGYLNGMEDHYTQYFGGLEGIDLTLDENPAIGMNGTYGTFMYVGHMVDAINKHDFSQAPFFGYMAFQNTHAPLEVPSQYLNMSIKDVQRQSYYGMATCLDEGVKNVTDALKMKGPNVWDNTLVVFSADNGGPTQDGACNYPKRGGKYTDFEGGVVAVAFASGGLIPASARGTSTDEIVHICDWWRTFANLAGVTSFPKDEGVPAADSLDVWAAITSGGKTPSPRTKVWVSSHTVIVGDYKLTSEPAGPKNTWQNPIWPDGNSTKGPACSPCIFDVVRDPNEHSPITNATLLALLEAELTKAQASAYQTGDDKYTGGYNKCVTMDEFKAAHSNFIGPICEFGGPSPPPPPPQPVGGFKLMTLSGSCLTVSGEYTGTMGSGDKVEPSRPKVDIGPCDQATLWQSSMVGGKEFISSTSNACLRSMPHVPDSCKAGACIIAGKCPPGVGDYFNNSMLMGAACTGFCIGQVPVNGSAAELVECTDKSASGWKKVPANATQP